MNPTTPPRPAGTAATTAAGLTFGVKFGAAVKCILSSFPL